MLLTEFVFLGTLLLFRDEMGVGCNVGFGVPRPMRTKAFKGWPLVTLIKASKKGIEGGRPTRKRLAPPASLKGYSQTLCFEQKRGSKVLDGIAGTLHSSTPGGGGVRGAVGCIPMPSQDSGQSSL